MALNNYTNISNITDVTQQKITNIKNKSILVVGNNPSDSGMTSQQIKKAFVDPIIDTDDSAISELKRVITAINTVIGSVNTSFGNITNETFVDLTVSYASDKLTITLTKKNGSTIAVEVTIGLAAEITKITNGTTLCKKAECDDDGNVIKTTYQTITESDNDDAVLLAGINQLQENKLNITDIENSLISDNANKVLAAPQGKELKTSITNIETRVTSAESNITSLDTNKADISKLGLRFNSSDGKVYLQYDGVDKCFIDLPTELVLADSGSEVDYDNELIKLKLANGQYLTFSIASIVNGLTMAGSNGTFINVTIGSGNTINATLNNGSITFAKLDSALQGRIAALENDDAPRVTAEQARVSAENSRVSAEQGRVNAEQLRASAESIRISAETNRTNAEQLRVTAEQNRQSVLDNKVDKVTGKGLSTNDYTTEEKNKLAGLQRQCDGFNSLLHKTVVASVEEEFNGGTISVPSQATIDTINYDVLDDQHFTLDNIKGKTLVENQKIKCTDFFSGTEYNAQYQHTSNTVTVIISNGALTNQSQAYVDSQLIGNHKYLLKGCPSGGNYNDSYSLSVNIGGVSHGPLYDIGNGLIIDTSSYGFITNGCSIIILFKAGTPAGTYVFQPQLIDLTLKFGAGNEPLIYSSGTTIDSMNSVIEYNRLFGTTYVPYNTGALKDTKAKTVEQVGYNWFTGTNWVQGKKYEWSDGVTQSNNTDYNICTDYIEIFDITDSKYLQDVTITEYYFYFFDKDKHYIQVYPTFKAYGSTFTIPSNAKYVRIGVYKSGGSALPTQCLLTTDTTATIADYKPYHKSIITLPSEITLKGLGVVQDKLYVEKNTDNDYYSLKKLSNIQDCDLGDKELEPDGSYVSHYFSDIVIPSSNDVVPNIISDKYNVVSFNNIDSSSNAISVSQNGYVCCTDSTPTGNISYEKVTPTTTTLFNNLTLGQVMLLAEQGGTIQVKDNDGNMQLCNITFDFDIKYFQE